MVFATAFKRFTIVLRGKLLMWAVAQGRGGGARGFGTVAGQAQPFRAPAPARAVRAVRPRSCKGTRRVQLVRRDGRDVSTLYGREGGGGASARRRRPRRRLPGRRGGSFPNWPARARRGERPRGAPSPRAVVAVRRRNPEWVRGGGGGGAGALEGGGGGSYADFSTALIKLSVLSAARA